MAQNTLKFDTLKSRAKSQIGYALQNDSSLGSAMLAHPDSWRAFELLATMALHHRSYSTVERPALVEFAQKFEINTTGDLLALQAKNVSEQKKDDIRHLAKEIALVALRARAESFTIIDAWDVRCVARLIELFPGIVNKKQRKSPIRVFMADNANCDWMVEFTG